MANIAQIDRNLQPDEVSDGLCYYDVRRAPFRISGLWHPERPGRFRRLPEEVAKAMSDGAHFLHTNTSGGRVRFRTSSRIVAIRAEFPSLIVMPHQALGGSSCFDLYADGAYCRTFLPTVDYQGGFAPHFSAEGGYSAQIELPDAREREILIHFPTYNDVTALYVGLEEGASLAAPAEYTVKDPVVFYGSSITQGCAANKPGDIYPAILSRWLDTEILNLGFSGNARAEDCIAEYIAGLTMSAFVYDYDHNAPTAEHLQNTHERMFRILREKQPELPILMATRPDWTPTEDNIRRREIVLETYRRAKARGDGNVYFIDGATIFDLLDRNLCTADGCHPTTLGFYCMAMAFRPVLEQVLYPNGR